MRGLSCRIFLGLIAILVCLPTFAYNFQSGGIYYNINDNKNSVSVTSGDTKYSGNITIPSYVTYNGQRYGVTGVGERAFSFCYDLTSITIPTSVTSIGLSAFYYCTALTSVTIPNSMTNIGDNAFQNCTGLTSITIPNSVIRIGSSAFENCTKLTSITIPNSVTSIGESAFSNCSSLSSVDFSNSVTTIGEYAFFNCSRLTSINLPNTVSTIGQYAFNGCSALKTIDSEIKNPFFINYSVFSVYSTATLTVPKGTKSAYQSTNYWKNFSNIVEATSESNDEFGKVADVVDLGLSVKWASWNIGASKIGDYGGLYGAGDPTGKKTSTSTSDYYFKNGESICGTEYDLAHVKWGDPWRMPKWSELEELMTKCSWSNGEVDGVKGCWVKGPNGNSIFLPWAGNRKGASTFSSKGSYGFYWSGDMGVKLHSYGYKDMDISYGGVTQTDGAENYWGQSIRPVYDEQDPKKKTIHVAIAGTLSDLISSSDKYTIEKLTLTGELNGTDFRLLRDMAGNNYLGEKTYSNLAILDLTNAKIVAGGEKYLDTNKINGNGVQTSGSFHYDILNSDVIPDYLFYGCNLREIHIPNSVTSIGNYSFEYCRNLTSISIPNSVASIGEAAFSYCSGLTSISIPNSVTSIGDAAFCYCSNLTSISISNSVTSIGYSVFSYCSGLNSISIPNSVMTIGEAAFEGCSGLTSITLSNSMTSIGDAAFYGCKGLKSITIPNSVMSVGNSSFYGCSSLTSVIISNSVTNIGNYAFSSCSGLTSITIPNSVTIIGDNAFSSCSSLISVTLSKSLTSVGNYAFYGCSGLTSVTLTNSVKNIGNYAFSSCSSLTSVTLSNSLTSIGNYSFYNCSGLTSIIIPNSVTKIGDTAFSSCSGLTSVTLSNSLTSIGKYAFRGCSGLTSLSIPNSVTSIGESAFYGCSGLKDVISEIKVPFKIASSVFSVYSTAKLTVPKGTKSAYQSTNYWSEFSTIVESTSGDDNTGAKRTIHVATAGTLPNLISELEKYLIEELTLTGELNGTDFRLLRDMSGNNYLGQNTSGKLVVLDLTNAKVVAGGEKYLDTDRIIGNGVNSSGSFRYNISKSDIIPDYVFFGCYLMEMHVPNSVTSIGNNSFEHCSNLTSISIPNSVTSIGDAAFYICSRLTSISIPSSVTSIGDYAFTYCSGLTSIKVESGNTVYDSRNNCNAIIRKSNNELFVGCKNTVIPNSVTSIGVNAFSGCYDLTSITIPNSVMSIGDYAFSWCSGLTSISIPNSVTSIGDNAFEGCSSLSSITIPNSVTIIGSSAFLLCSSLTSITIPNSVMSIGDNAFYYSNLKDITSEIKTPFEINENVFTVYSTAKLTVPKGTKSAYQSTSSWNKFTNIVEAEGGNVETEVTFSSNGITYKGTIATQRGEVTAVGSNSKNLEIPSSVSYDGKSYSVTSIKSGALDGLSLNYLSIPSSVTSLDNTIFSKCDLGALIWKANYALSYNVFSNAKFSTASNFLLYVNSASYAPSNVKNVVVGTSANTILLSDNGGNFYCPKEFTAQTISYTHNYSMTTGGNGKGWETLALPFDVQKIEHKTKGTLTPFAKYNSADDSQRPFWLYKLDSNGFKRSDAIKANTPYIIAMPNDSKYDSEYILSGDVTFSASNVKVVVTSSLEIASSGNKFFKPAFSMTEKASVIYPLNVSNSRVSNSSSDDAGSRFISNLRSVYPFEAYMTTSSSNARTIAIEFDDDVTSIDIIPAAGNAVRDVKVYSLSGILLLQTDRESLPKQWEVLPAGVYIVNGKKIVK